MTHFPPGALPEATARRCSGELDELGEPRLGADSAETVRFLWLRTFHPAVAIRVTFSESGPAQLCLKVAGGTRGGERRLSAAETDTARAVLAFLARGEAPDGETGRDGSEWIFEYRSRSVHSVVMAWSPGKGAWHAAGLNLIGLSGLALKPYEIY